MFLYFNQSGELTTCIPHGEPPRQGNDLNVWIAVDKQYFTDKTPGTPAGWGVKAHVVYSEQEATTGFPAQYLGVQTFRKKADSEITYDLVEGYSYYMYYCKIPSSYSTVNYGTKSLVAKFYTRKLQIDGAYSEEEVEEYAQEVCDIYIEKTFGRASDSSTISKAQYDVLKSRIDAVSVGTQKRSVYDDTTVKNMLDAFNSFVAGDSPCVLYGDALIQVLSAKEDEGDIIIYGLLDKTVLKFEFNQDAELTEEVVPTEVDLASGSFDSIGIYPIEGVLSEEEIVALYENNGDGKYSIKSEEFGDEIIIIFKEKELFKRFTAGYDYTFDFELNEWQIASGGGGAGGGNVVLTALSSIYKKVSIESEKIIKYSFKLPIGTDGTAIYYINGKVVKTESVKAKKEITFDASKWLNKEGTYTVRVEIRDNNANSASLEFVFDIITLKLTSDFQENVIRKNDFIIDITIPGNFQKTTHVLIDSLENEDLSNTFTESTGEILISGLSHGVHEIEIYVTANIGEEYDEYIDSNVLKFTIIFADMENEEIIIKSKFNKTYAEEGDSISIDYVIFNTQSEETVVTRKINSVEIQSPTNKNGEQNYWNVTLNEIGQITLTLETENSSKDFVLQVEESDVNIQPIKNGLVLEMVADGKDNDLIEDRKKWEGFNAKNEKVVEATLENFNWNTNGWINNLGQSTFLRLNSKAKVVIPFKIFNTDFLESGKTIEFDFSTTNVSNIDKQLIVSFAENKGFILKSNECLIKSEQSEVSTKFKEDERVKVSFVVQRSGSSTRLIKTFINGVMSGLERYEYNPETGAGDNFTQTSPSDIIINPDGGDIDVYSIRIYDKPLTDDEIVNNYISGLTLDKKKEKNKVNSIFDSNGNVSFQIIKDKKIIPYLIFTGPELPQAKGDKKNMDVEYVNPNNPNKNFNYKNVVWDIQGTSSVSYPRKNWKAKFPSAFALYDNAIPEDTYTFKADFMESSHSHNTGNAMFINTIAPKFPTQNDNPNVRNTIYGFPILMFYRKNEDATPEYQGVYNFNNDKGNAATLGLTTEKAESWEFKNSTSDRCRFLTNDFTGNVSEDFEARYPDKYKNYDALSRVVSWVFSTKDDINKFKNEFEEYFNLEACLFYYTMMDVMLAMDSRAKNMFLDTVDGVIWYPRWYDIDTTYGLDNNGYNKFGYGLEQTDEFGSGFVYNGHESVLWNNFGEAYAEEIAEYYLKLRSDGLSYESMIEFLQDKQIDCISESMYNTDANYKYVGPLIEKNDETYLYVAQGSRLNHLQWWLSNRFRYLDSKYNHPSFESDYIYFKITAPNNVAVTPNPTFTVTPFIDMYARVKYASYPRFARAKANTPTTVTIESSFVPTDSEVWIYGASQIVDIGDLSNKYISTNDFSRAVKLKKIILGNSNASYKNENIYNLKLGNNKMLEVLDIRNCPNLTGSINLLQCVNIKEVYAKGSSITGITLPDGGNLEKLQLPKTITNLFLSNQPNLSIFEMESYENLQTVTLIGMKNLNTKVILNSSNNLQEVNVDNIDWNLRSQEQFLLDKLYNISNCTLKGKIKINGRVGIMKYQRWLQKWPNLEIEISEPTTDYIVNFWNEKQTEILYIAEVLIGETAEYIGELPTKPDFEGYGYTFWKWSEDISNITKNMDVYPLFTYDRPSSWTWNVSDLSSQPNLIVSVMGDVAKVDWGDNTIQNFNLSGNTTLKHNYNSVGYYDVVLSLPLDPPSGTSSSMNMINFVQATTSALDDELYLQDTVEHITSGSSYSRYTSTVKTIHVSKMLRKIVGISWSSTEKIYYKGDSLNDWFKIEFDSRLSNPLKNGGEFYINGERLENEHIVINIEQTNQPVFYGANFIDTLEFTEKVNSIGTDFASQSSVKKIIFNQKTNFGSTSFENCENLETVELRMNNKDWIEWDDTYFNTNRHTNLKEILVFDDNSELKNVIPGSELVIPNDIEKIGSKKFYDNLQIKNISFDSNSSLKEIGQDAFSYTSITSLEFPDSVEGSIFCTNGCTKLTKIVFPPKATSVGGCSNCSNLSEIYIPEGVTYVGSFNNCKSLKDIVLPSTVTSIGSGAFSLSYGGSSYESIRTYTIKAVVPPTLSGVTSLGAKAVIKKIYVPAESVGLYKAATNWIDYADKIEAIPEEA